MAMNTPTEAWIEAYCSGESPSVDILDELPTDWRYPEATS